LGDGNDTLNDFAYAKFTYGWGGVLKIGAGVDPANIETIKTGNNLILIIGESGEHLTIQDWYASANYQLGRIEFADGNSWDRSSGKSIEAYFQELAAASQQTRDPVHQMFAMGTMLDYGAGLSQFSFGQPQGMVELSASASIEANREKQLIVDIAIAELQMELDSGMICNNGSINISDSHSQNCFAASSVGVNPTEENKNAV
jgi:hypothetical protein